MGPEPTWHWLRIMKDLIFGQIQQRQMAASRSSWIRSISNFTHWYIRSLSTSFLFIMYINYDHGSHKLWKLWISAKFSIFLRSSRPLQSVRRQHLAPQAGSSDNVPQVHTYSGCKISGYHKAYIFIQQNAIRCLFDICLRFDRGGFYWKTIQLKFPSHWIRWLNEML